MNYIFFLLYDVCRRLPGGGKKSTPPPMPTILGPPPLHPPCPSVGQAGSLSQSLVGPASWAAQVAQVLSFPHSPPLLFEQPVDIEYVSFVKKTVHPQNLRLLIFTDIVMCGIICCVMLSIVKGYWILGCVWYWSIFSHNFHLWNRIRLITLNQ